MYQTWSHVLFLHYQVPIETLRELVPEELEIDSYNGMGWIGVVPFLMSDIRFPYTPAIPYISRFPELNVRTYVTYKGKSGVYFFSCDAKSQLAVFFGNRFYHLPYIYSDIEASFGDTVHFHSKREKTELSIEYRPKGFVFTPEKGTLEYFLTERYALFTKDGPRNLYSCEITHDQWQLQEADFSIMTNTMGNQIHLDLPSIPSHVLYGNRVKVFIKRDTFKLLNRKNR